MYIINLDSVDEQIQEIGQKASNLGVLMKAGFSVPKGFVVTSEGYEKFLLDTGISGEVPGILSSINPEEPKTVFEASGKIRSLFQKVSGNDFLIKELRDAYNELCFGKDVNVAGRMALDLVKAGRTENFVSVRPSFICPGSAVSFPGHGKAMLNQISYRQILASVKECWLSVFSPEAIMYRKVHGIEKFSLAVIVQRMVDSELSGKLFTSDPVSGDRSKSLVEGFWGLGETLCCGCLSPDQYFIDKVSGSLASKRVGKKIYLRRRGPLSGQTIQEKVPLNKVFMETMGERDFPRFAAMAGKLEEIFKGPQEVEWGVERGRVVLLQAKPVVFSRVTIQPSQEAQPGQDGMKVAETEKMQPSFKGIGVSAGTAQGKGCIWKENMERPVSPGILITKNLGMELLPYMKWFSGIVSEQGGSGSCLSSVARELGIPVVTGVENAAILLAGKEISMDGGKGGGYFS